MTNKRKLLTSKQALEILGLSRNALRLLRLQGQLSTIKVNDEGKAAPAGGFWYNASEVNQLKRTREQIQKLQDNLSKKGAKE